MKVRMKKLEEGRKSVEEKEREGRNKFLEDWKMKVARKKKQEIVQKVWKSGRSCRKESWKMKTWRTGLLKSGRKMDSRRQVKCWKQYLQT